MPERFDVAEALGPDVPDRHRAWRFIREFVAAWSQPLAAGAGVEPDELRQAERDLGLTLPVAVREAYLLFGRRDDLTGTEDPLLGPRSFEVDDTGEVLVLRVSGQSPAEWGIRLADLADPDPPVRYRLADGGWQPLLDRFSLACLDLVLTEVLFGPGRLDNGAELPTGLIELVESGYRRVAVPDYPMWLDPDSSPVRWFSAPGQLLCLAGSAPWAWLFVRGQTPADLAALCRTVPAAWTQGNGDGTASRPVGCP